MQTVITHNNRATPTIRQKVALWVDSSPVQNAIIYLIVFNAITLGLDTSVTVRDLTGGVLGVLEKAVLAVFVAELSVKLYAYGWRFFRSYWNIFDLAIVVISVGAASGPLSVLRALRILRVLVLLTKIERLRSIVESLLRALPSIGWVALLLSLVFYIYAVIGTGLFGESFPQYFGHLGRSLYTLFQIMTLESWSHGISRPVLEVYPMAWVYFVSFVALSAFVVLNLFIGIIVSTMQEQQQEQEALAAQGREDKAHKDREELIAMVRDIQEQISKL
jgi:voltage-gated sodium channel